MSGYSGAGAGRGRAVHVPVAQAVAVPLQSDDLGVVHEAVDHRRGDHLIAEDLPQAEKGLLEVTIIEARS